MGQEKRYLHNSTKTAFPPSSTNASPRFSFPTSCSISFALCDDRLNFCSKNLCEFGVDFNTIGNSINSRKLNDWS